MASERRCAFEGCGVRFVPEKRGQLYHAVACRDANEKARKRRRRRRARPASPQLEPEAAPPRLLGVMVEVEQRTSWGKRPEVAVDAMHAALLASDAAVLGLLRTTLAKVAAANAAGDRTVLREELVELAALGVDLAARQPRPVPRRTRARAA
jgi:hypothetical protein